MGCIRISRVIGICTAAVMLLCAAPAGAAPVDDRQTCARASADVAIAACTRAIASRRYSGSNLAKIYYNRGVEYRGKGEPDRAIGDFNETIRLDPKYAWAYNNRGIAYRAKGDLDRAIADYNEAIRLDPKNASAFYNRGIAYEAKGDLDRAIADFGEAIRRDPKFALIFYTRGMAYNDKGDLDRAIADYTEAIRLDPKYVNAYHNRGIAYYDSQTWRPSLRHPSLTISPVYLSVSPVAL